VVDETADNLEGQPLEGSAGSADAGADFDESQLAAGEDALTDDGAAEEQSDEAQQENWTPEQRKVYLQATNKYAGQLKQANDRLAELERDAAVAKARADMLERQAQMSRQPQEPEEPMEPIDPNVQKRLRSMIRQLPEFQELEQLRSLTRDTMAARPEVYVDEDMVPPDIRQEIMPQLRQTVQNMKSPPTPEVIKTIAARLAAPVMAKQIAAAKAEKAAAAKARDVKRQQMTRANSGTSSGMDSEGRTFADMSTDEQGAMLEELMGGMSLERLADME
jgi:hypothetical protein